MSKRRRGIAVGIATMVSFVVAAGVAGAATKPVVVGFADDAGKYLDGVATPRVVSPAEDDSVGTNEDAVVSPLTQSEFFQTLLATGASTNRMTVLWDPSRPLEIPQRAFLDAAVLAATTHRIDVILSVRSAKAAGLTASPARPAQFARFLAALARAYPQVRTFVVGNEPNQPWFWQPQFTRRKRVAAAAYERVLAVGYDALKRVDRKIRVVAAGVSSRGNDDPAAANNRSTSPVRFIRDLGEAYRRSRRARPIMDAFGFHPYPRASAEPLARGFDWPNAGFANLGRVKQALWDAFDGTPQPATEQGLPILIDEVGWQASIPASTREAYFGIESTPVTSERGQAAVYSQLIRRAACDGSVSGVLLFPLLDEPDLDRFQSGILRADGTRRPAFDAVRGAIRATRGGCGGATEAWRHRTTVAASRVQFGPSPRSGARRALRFRVVVAEDVRYDARIVRLAAPDAGHRRVTQSALAAGTTVAAAKGSALAHRESVVTFPTQPLRTGAYVYVVELRAAMNPRRAETRVSPTFTVANST